ncbi:hypothetical protein [Delftia acidovorans]|uniref:hypothetical protein n=1 Tax=Delftia acidovorans TaxID=80866 RepID=UPI0012EDA3D7|nr:hypothetical protein [Delftia acidovorans]QPS74034.1 hypothetical protein I6G48_25890 [Delftia acidovorans]
MRLLMISAAFAAAVLASCGGSKAISEKRGFVSHGMRDPASTQFRNEKLRESGWLCGEVNAKNAYGAYVGFKRFLAKDAASVYVEGAGKVGVGESQHQELIRDIELETQAMKESYELRQQGKLTIDSYADWVKQRVFDIRWKDICA